MPTYAIINKPVDYTSDTTDASHKQIIELLTPNNLIGPYQNQALTNLLPADTALKADYEGLVLLTDDFNLLEKIADKIDKMPKIYEVTIGKPLARDAKKVMEKGMMTETGILPGILIKREFNKGRRTIITVAVTDEKGQIKTLFTRLGYTPLVIRRIQFGRLKLGTLPPGRFTFVKKENII